MMVEVKLAILLIIHIFVLGSFHSERLFVLPAKCEAEVPWEETYAPASAHPNMAALALRCSPAQNLGCTSARDILHVNVLPDISLYPKERCMRYYNSNKYA